MNQILKGRKEFAKVKNREENCFQNIFLEENSLKKIMHVQTGGFYAFLSRP